MNLICLFSFILLASMILSHHGSLSIDDEIQIDYRTKTPKKDNDGMLSRSAAGELPAKHSSTRTVRRRDLKRKERENNNDRKAGKKGKRKSPKASSKKKQKKKSGSSTSCEEGFVFAKFTISKVDISKKDSKKSKKNSEKNGKKNTAAGEKGYNPKVTFINVATNEVIYSKDSYRGSGDAIGCVKEEDRYSFLITSTTSDDDSDDESIKMNWPRDCLSDACSGNDEGKTLQEIGFEISNGLISLTTTPSLLEILPVLLSTSHAPRGVEESGEFIITTASGEDGETESFLVSYRLVISEELGVVSLSPLASLIEAVECSRDEPYIEITFGQSYRKEDINELLPLDWMVAVDSDLFGPCDVGATEELEGIQEDHRLNVTDGFLIMRNIQVNGNVVTVTGDPTSYLFAFSEGTIDVTRITDVRELRALDHRQQQSRRNLASVTIRNEKTFNPFSFLDIVISSSLTIEANIDIVHLDWGIFTGIEFEIEASTKITAEANITIEIDEGKEYKFGPKDIDFLSRRLYGLKLELLKVFDMPSFKMGIFSEIPFVVSAGIEIELFFRFLATWKASSGKKRVRYRLAGGWRNLESTITFPEDEAPSEEEDGLNFLPDDIEFSLDLRLFLGIEFFLRPQVAAYFGTLGSAYLGIPLGYEFGAEFRLPPPGTGYPFDPIPPLLANALLPKVEGRCDVCHFYQDKIDFVVKPLEFKAMVNLTFGDLKIFEKEFSKTFGDAPILVIPVGNRCELGSMTMTCGSKCCQSCAELAEEHSAEDETWDELVDLKKPCPCTEVGASHTLLVDENPVPGFFHPGADVCYRGDVIVIEDGQVANVHGQQCCYSCDDSERNVDCKLITDGPGAGTVDYVSPTFDKRQHFLEDVVPSFFCGLAAGWKNYAIFRPIPHVSENCTANPTTYDGLPSNGITWTPRQNNPGPILSNLDGSVFIPCKGLICGDLDGISGFGVPCKGLLDCADDEDVMQARALPSIRGSVGDFYRDLFDFLDFPSQGVPFNITLPEWPDFDVTRGPGFDNRGQYGDSNSNKNKFGLGNGEPHIRTLDGLEYDCQAVGEFVVMRSDSGFEVQARHVFSPVDIGRSASQIGAIVVRGRTTGEFGIPSAPVLQFEISASSSAMTLNIDTIGGTCHLNLSIDGVLQNLNNIDSIILLGVEVVQLKSDLLGLIYEGGEAVGIKMQGSEHFGCLLAIKAFFPGSFFEEGEVEPSVGLWGTPTGSIHDDWIDENRVSFSPPRTRAERLGQMAYDYCRTNWCIRDETDSLFTYAQGVTFSGFFHCDDPYRGSVDLNEASDELRSLCQSNEQCLVDGILGDLNDARNVLEEQFEAETIFNYLSSLRVEPPFLRVGVPTRVFVTLQRTNTGPSAAGIESYTLFSLDALTDLSFEGAVTSLTPTSFDSSVFFGVFTIISHKAGEVVHLMAIPVIEGQEQFDSELAQTFPNVLRSYKVTPSIFDDDIPAPTPFPSASFSSDPGFQLCSDNIPVSVSIGPNSNPSGSFNNVPTEQSLSNVVDCLAPDAAELHTQASHVWWTPGPLELIFDFNSTEYDLKEIYFWNYFGEDFDVDQIDFTFYDALGQLVAEPFTVFPTTGRNPEGEFANPVVSETLPVPFIGIRASRVSAILRSTNGELDFQNFVFQAYSL